MVLSRIIAHMKLNKRAALRDMAVLFDVSPQALAEMLKTLERKGKIFKLPSQTPCSGGCRRCSPDSVELYEWIDRPSRQS